VIALRAKSFGLRHYFVIGHWSFVILAMSLMAFGACRKPEVAKPRVDSDGPVELLLPAKGAYTGAFIDFGDAEDEVKIETIEEFEKMVGKHQAIVASSSYWGEQSFPTRNLTVIWRYGALPLVFWSPWDRPYNQNRGPDKFSLTAIVEGKWDAYIDKWADGAREFGKPMIVAFANEMNGDWFPWSGWYYGADRAVRARPVEWEGPARFKQAYRHVVDRVRARGAANVKWMFHTNNYSSPNDTWNYAPAYYPGGDYVDWLGMSVYGQQFKGEPNPDIPSLVDWPYEEMCSLDPNKPVMIAEWGTGEFPHVPEDRGLLKHEWIAQGLEMFRARYPRLKAAIYWHERWQNRDLSYSNLRVNSSVEALEAYRAGIAHPDWHGELMLRPMGEQK
jgi:beta-mannanase